MNENSALQYEGHVDDLLPDWIRGWVWAPEQPSQTVTVELVDGWDRVLARTDASLFRADLEEAGKRRGRCGFELSIPEANGPLKLWAKLAGVDADGHLMAEGVQAPRPEGLTDDSRRMSNSDGVVGWLDRADENGLVGWCHTAEPFQPPLTLELVEGDRVLATGCAGRWRNDLQDLRQGDGRCGFYFELPDSLYDGEEHLLALRLAGGEPLTKAPVALRLPPQPPARAKAAAPQPTRPAAGGAPAVSILVNFYNMQREAARTLLSLSRRFQEGVEALDYEVICIDNGSDPPLDPAFVESFGPEFRLFRPSVVEKSPCRALNEAASLARGRWLAIMIDGAHVLSPGVLREAHIALAAQPDAIVALRQWFIGGDQRWFSAIGYSQAHEDILYERINWPFEGYRLFDISTPMYESPNSWLDGISESNCLFVAKDLYISIGGLDTAFNIPGAGFANLDLFRRASEGASAVVGLIGEASFHQYHGGITTNVSDMEKDRRVRAYASDYEELRGGGFVNVEPKDIRLSGSVRTGLALTARQRPFCPANLGVTDQVRPRPANIQFDEEAQRYLQSAYVETGRHTETRWRGLQVGVAPTDLIDIQETLWRVRPERVLLFGTSLGLTVYVRSILQGLDLADTKVAFIGADTQEAATDVIRIVGALGSPSTRHQVEAVVEDAERVLVLLQPGVDDALPIPLLESCARFVSFGSYLVVLGTALGQPWLGYSRSWLYRAIVRFTHSHPDFVIDRSLNRHFVTTCPSGFLRRVLQPHTAGTYDEELDDLSGV